MHTLNTIIQSKLNSVVSKKELYPIKLLEKSIYFKSEPVSLSKYLLRSDKIGLIAEFKRASPSRGLINKYAKIEEISVGYMQAGASAISVLTDEEFFSGKNEDLITTRELNFCPILRKDFIIDSYQIIESKSIGADAILLIADILTKKQIKEFTQLAENLGMEVLLEIHSKDEIQKASSKNSIIGVNNRNLNNMKTSLENSISLIQHIKDFPIRISESGINSAEDIVELGFAGYNGFLIGTRFMQTPHPHVECKKFVTYVKDKRKSLCLA
ncbi:MAG: indole-3-glycerol phosphate synthase TrpC [Bacteroidia bacterium]